MTKIIKSEKQKANLWLFFNTFLTIFNTLVGFLTVKIIIIFYGENINGINRLISQILTYITVLNGGIFIPFSVQLIRSFQKNNKDDFNNFYWWFLKISKKISMVFFCAVFLMSLVSGIALKDDNISFLLIFLIFFAPGLTTVFTLWFLSINTLSLIAIGKGYLSAIITLFCKVIFYFFFFITILWKPPGIESIKQEGETISIFQIKNVNKVFNLSIGLFILSIEPIFEGIVTKFFLFRKNKFINLLAPKNSLKKFKEKHKSKVFKNFYNSIIFNVGLVIINNTDEFAILLLKNSYSINYVLKQITIYGLYFSVLINIRELLNNYSNSKKQLYSDVNKDKKEYTILVKEIIGNNQLIGAIFLFSGLILTPLIINVFFATGSDSSYINFNFCVPILLWNWLYIINNPISLKLQMNNRLSVLYKITLIEAIINVSLSFSLVIKLGIAWIIWSSFIAALIKIIITEIYFYYSERKKFVYFNFKLTRLKFAGYILSLIIFGFEVFLVYFINFNEIISEIYFYLPLLILLFIWIFTIIIIFGKKIKEILSINNQDSQNIKIV